MVSTLLFSMSALCFAAMLLPRRSSKPCQQLETYYVCDPESHPNPVNEAASPTLLGSPA